MKRVLLITTIVLVMAAGFIIWDMALLRNSAQNSGELYIGADDVPAHNTGKASTGIEGSSSEESAVGLFGSRSEEINTAGSGQSGKNAGSRAIIRSKPITVVGNTPEYEMQVTLCEAADLKPFIRIEYFMDGMSAMCELDERQLPEIEGILESTSGQQDDINTQSIQQLLLNPMYGQLYLMIVAKPADEYSQASFYKIGLGDMAVEKLFSYPAIYGKMVFNKDYSLLAYSFKDSPNMSAYQEDSMLEVYDCKAGKYVIKANRDADMQLIGSNSSPDFLYDYEFMSWNSLNTLRLKQGVRRMIDLGKAPVQNEVLYDIEENVLLNLDGSKLKPGSDQDVADTAGAGDMGFGEIKARDDVNANDRTGKSGETTDILDKGGTAQDGNQMGDSEPAKVLKSFYNYLQTEDNYGKAMDLLGDDFKLRMAMFRQFGVQEISKVDISAEYKQENVSLYSDFLKMAKLDIIGNETIVEENTVIITYYHILGINADSQLRQPMSARIVKTENGWKIVLIEDGVQ